MRKRDGVRDQNSFVGLRSIWRFFFFFRQTAWIFLPSLSQFSFLSIEFFRPSLEEGLSYIVNQRVEGKWGTSVTWSSRGRGWRRQWYEEGIQEACFQSQDKRQTEAALWRKRGNGIFAVTLPQTRLRFSAAAPWHPPFVYLSLCRYCNWVVSLVFIFLHLVTKLYLCICICILYFISVCVVYEGICLLL